MVGGSVGRSVARFGIIDGDEEKSPTETRADQSHSHATPQAPGPWPKYSVIKAFSGIHLTYFAFANDASGTAIINSSLSYKGISC